MSDALRQARLDKLRALQEKGIDPYPARVPAVESIEPLLERFASLANEEHSGHRTTIAGRILAFRGMGKATFLDVADGTAKIQGHARVDALGDAYETLSLTDVGDFVALTGEVFRTRRGELTIAVESWDFLSKSISPLPEKWHGLKDVETRYRHRSLDLISNDEIRKAFRIRSKLTASLRRTLDEQGFLEVETPVLLSIASGGHARPFATHHNALGIDLYLRIALELYLKRVMIGGIDRVYEMGKCFRNEGVSTRHNPEFTMLEIYQAYTDYEGMMRLVERLVTESLETTLGSSTVEYDGQTIDFSLPWKRMSMAEATAEFLGVDVETLQSERAIELCKERGIEPVPTSAGEALEALFERYVEGKLIQPTYITDYPVEISPLAKAHRADKRYVERFELFCAGMEIANAFSELNDPLAQRERFEAQEALRAGGNDEAQRMDEDFLYAMEHGMPPAGGMGIGVDRLAMLLTGLSSIREVILFPALRSREDT